MAKHQYKKFRSFKDESYAEKRREEREYNQKKRAQVEAQEISFANERIFHEEYQW
jgi:actin-related protein